MILSCRVLDHVLVQNELNNLKTFDSSCFNGKSYFEEDGRPDYLIFPPLLRYFKLNNKNSIFISSWVYRGLSDGTIEPPSTSSISPILDFYDNGHLRVNFIGSYLQQLNRLTYTKILNIYVVYELKASSSNDNDPTLKTWFIWRSYFN